MNTSLWFSRRRSLALGILAGLLSLGTELAGVAAEGGRLNIIAFGAHPDDCELQAGGTAALWAAKGHRVKFVSLTNGDIGHWRDAGGPLARRRKLEVEAAAKILGITTEVLDIHDGELMPTLETRRMVTRLIREWKADLVLGPRPNDYHPDHRYAGIVVQDAAYMVTVPHFAPDVPYLKSNPVFMYYPDGFQKPNPFKPDIVVPIDSVIDKKLDALSGMESQFLEGGANGSEELRPSDPAKLEQRRKDVRQGFANRNKNLAQRFRSQLTELVGGRAEQVQYVEAFELCEYGRRPDQQGLKRLFPFFDP
jgi:LmbE family N-acetylglucosaminyl deacetylase